MFCGLQAKRKPLAVNERLEREGETRDDCLEFTTGDDSLQADSVGPVRQYVESGVRRGLVLGEFCAGRVDGGAVMDERTPHHHKCTNPECEESWICARTDCTEELCEVCEQRRFEDYMDRRGLTVSQPDLEEMTK